MAMWKNLADRFYGSSDGFYISDDPQNLLAWILSDSNIYEIVDDPHNPLKIRSDGSYWILYDPCTWIVR